MNQKKIMSFFVFICLVIGSTFEYSLASYQDYIREQKKDSDLSHEEFNMFYPDYVADLKKTPSAAPKSFKDYIAQQKGHPFFNEYLQAQTQDWGNNKTFKQFLHHKNYFPVPEDQSIEDIRRLTAQQAAQPAHQPVANSSMIDDITALSNDITDLAIKSIRNIILKADKACDDFATRLFPIDLIHGMAQPMTYSSLFKVNYTLEDRIFRQYDTAKAYIDAGNNINILDDNDRSPLMIAIKNNNIAIVKLLLKTPGIDLNLKNKTLSDALSIAIKDSYIDPNIIKLILSDPRLNPDRDAFITLYYHYRYREDGKELIKLLLKNFQFDVNAYYDYEEPALIRSLFIPREYNLDIFNILLADPRIEVNTPNQFHKTVLLKAVELNNINAVQALVAAGADVNARDMQGKTPLFTAAYYGNIQIIQALLAAGADITIQDNDGRTAEQQASRQARAVIDAYKRKQNIDRSVTVAQAEVLRNGHRSAIAGKINSFL